jgi:hypothetical protein
LKGGLKMKQELIKKRKSNFDVDNATNVITGVIFVAILLAVLLLVISIIFGLSVFNGSAGGTNISGNISLIQGYIITMVANFFALMPTVGTILAVVILIAGIVLLVMYVRRMKDTGAGQTGFQG